MALQRRSGGLFQRLQIGFHGGVIDPQKLVGGSHHVGAVGFPIGTLLVHELVDRFIQQRILQIDGHDEEQRPPQRRCANFAHTLMPASHITGIGWQSIQPSVGHERFLRVEAAYISDFSYELWAERWAYTEHVHDNGIFRQHGSQ